MEMGHEYVDLGRGSGRLWAACNVGAERPEECGDYFAWGEVRTKREFTEFNNRWFGKYNETLVDKGRWGTYWTSTANEDGTSAWYGGMRWEMGVYTDYYLMYYGRSVRGW